MSAAWLTDLHLDIASDAAAVRLFEEVRASGADCVFLTGDIADARSVERHLGRLAAELQRPIYFVLGNHDYYGGSIGEVRGRIRQRCGESAHLRWLPAEGVVALGPSTGLVGHGGWSDARLGDWATTTVKINDYRQIAELTGHSHEELGARLRVLGTEAAEALAPLLEEGARRFEHLLVLTHSPPWREACWYQGHTTDDNWAPHFTCGALGALISNAACSHPEVKFEVLCGHTHSAGTAQLAPNLIARTGAAEYGAPAIEALLQLG